MVVGMQGGLNITAGPDRNRMKPVQDKLTLNSSTSSSCKQEVCRLKRDLKTSSGGSRGKGGTRLCRGHATTNKQEMIGDGRTPDIWHLPISTWIVCVMVLCITRSWCYIVSPWKKYWRTWYGFLSLKSKSCKDIELVVWRRVCRGQSCTAAVTDCDKHTQTEWYKLHTAAGINSASLPVDPRLVSSCRFSPAEGCNRTNKSRGPDRKWIGIDQTRPWVCAWSCW